MNHDMLKKLVMEQLVFSKTEKLVENKKYDRWKEEHGEVGSKYIDSKGVEHDDPWDSEDMPDPEPEDDKEDELELELEE